MDNNTLKNHKGFNIKKDSYIKRKKVEDTFFSNSKTDLIFCLNDEYLIALNSISNTSYYFGYFFKSRYINQSLQVLPELEQTTDTNMSKLFQKAKETLEKQNKEIGPSDSIDYEVYRPTNRRRLKDMLNHLIGEENTSKMLTDDSSFKFGLIEFLFFSFLLDTYSDRDAKKFRKKAFSSLSRSYYHRLKRGVEILSLFHPFIGDPKKIINSWHYEAGISKQKLEKELAIFNKAIERALDVAYSSDETQTHIDYIQDIVAEATTRVNNINK